MLIRTITSYKDTWTNMDDSSIVIHNYIIKFDHKTTLWQGSKHPQIRTYDQIDTHKRINIFKWEY